jgi:hypothetical protein
MNALELEEILAAIPKEKKVQLTVLVAVQDHLKPGMFAFAEACSCETGLTTLGPDENMENEGQEVFLVLPHGFGVPEDEIDNEQIPELN